MTSVGATFRLKGQVQPQALFWQEEREFPFSSLRFHLLVSLSFQKFFNLFQWREFMEVVREGYSLVNTHVMFYISSLKNLFFPSKQVSKTQKTSSRGALRAPLFCLRWMFCLLLMLCLPFSVLLQSVVPQLWSQQNSTFWEDTRWPQMVLLIVKTALLFPLQQWSSCHHSTWRRWLDLKPKRTDEKTDVLLHGGIHLLPLFQLGKKAECFKVPQERKLQVKMQRASLR